MQANQTIQVQSWQPFLRRNSETELKLQSASQRPPTVKLKDGGVFFGEGDELVEMGVRNT